MSSLKDLTPIQNAVSSSSVPGSKENGPGMGGDKSDSNADSTGNGEPGATDDAKPKTPRELADDYLTILLHSMAFNVFMGVLTMFALVADDARLAFAEREDDWWLQGMSAVGMFLFMFELSLQFYLRKEYRWGFYFVLDVVSTASMLPDTGWLDSILIGDSSATGNLKAAKTSRAGAKASRIVKIVRLIRMVRIFKLMKIKAQKDEDEEEADEKERGLDAEPSKVGKKLTELTVRRVILIVLGMIMAFPFLDSPAAFLGSNELNTLQREGVENLHMLATSLNRTGGISEGIYKERVQAFALQDPDNEGSYQTGNILHLRLSGWDVEVTNDWISSSVNGANGHDLVPLDDIFGEDSNFRVVDRPVYFAGNSNSTHGTMAIFSIADSQKAASELSLGLTGFVIIILVFAVIGFSRDAETLVIGPIERMINLVKKLSENPLASLYSEKHANDAKGTDAFETQMLESTLEKISSLLQVGFGVAGAQIISSNMSSGGDLDVMIPGKKITSIFGFGIIEEFTNTCSCLEEEMCTYINTIAKIIHDNSIRYHGAPNKNIGSAFLLAWKICDGVLPGLRDLREPEGEELDRNTKRELRDGIGAYSKGMGQITRLVGSQEIVDSAMVSILRMQIDLHDANKENGVLSEFKSNNKLRGYFGDQFDVNMGFGIHIGWAIEGAIGSQYKIDASYLSPNVNMAARLEAATHQFGCPMLLSGPFVNELSDRAKNMCRKVDVVTVKGSQTPLEIWTVDISDYKLEDPSIVKDVQQPVDFDVVTEVQKTLDADFTKYYTLAMNSYIAGDWGKAKVELERAMGIMPEDGPSKSLMGVMRGTDFVAPKDWKGFRALTSK